MQTTTPIMMKSIDGGVNGIIEYRFSKCSRKKMYLVRCIALLDHGQTAFGPHHSVLLSLLSQFMYACIRECVPVFPCIFGACIYIYIYSEKHVWLSYCSMFNWANNAGGMVGVESPCELYPMHLQSNCNHRCGVDDGDGQCYMWVGWCNKLHTVDFYCSMFARCVRVATNLSKNFVLFHSFHVVALAAHMHSCVINDCWWLGWLNKLTAKATSHYTLLGQPMYHWQSSAHSALVMQSIFLKHCMVHVVSVWSRFHWSLLWIIWL